MKSADDDFAWVFLLICFVGFISIIYAADKKQKAEVKPIINCGVCHTENIDYSKGE